MGGLVPVYGLDPSNFRTRETLAGAHKALMDRAGLSPRKVENESQEPEWNVPPYVGVGKSTLYAWCRPNSLPPRDSAYRTFLAICEVPAHEIDHWLAALDEVRKLPPTSSSAQAPLPEYATAAVAVDEPEVDEPDVDGELEAVLERWSHQRRVRWEEALARARALEPGLPVTWATVEGAGDAEGAASRTGSGTDLLDLLLHGTPARRVLLVGPSGSGKSVLLVELALAMALDARRGRTPYPLLLSPPSDAAAKPFETWLVEQLVLDEPDLGAPGAGGYRSLAEQAVRTGRVLPVLDGLDEVGDTAEDRLAVVESIDWWLVHSTGRGVVVAARREDGAPLPPCPSSATVVTIRDVDRADALPYLVRHAGGDVWLELLTTPAVGGAMRRPLPIALASAVYGRSPSLVRDPAMPRPSPRELEDLRDEDAVTGHLVDRFLPLAFGADTERARRWLRTLAAWRRRLVWWELADGLGGRFPLVPAFLALPGALAVGLVAGLVPRLGIGLGCGIYAAVGAALAAARVPVPARWRGRGGSEIGWALATGFVSGLVGALLGGIVAYLTGASDDQWRGVVGGLGAGIAAGAVRGPVAAVPGGLVGGLVVAFTANLGPGWPAGLIDGTAAWLAAALAIQRHRTRLPVRAPRRPPWAIVVSSGVVCGVGVGTAAGRLHGAAFGVVAGLVVGVVAGCAIGSGATPLALGGLAAEPRAVLRSDRKTFVFLLLLGGGALGLGAGAAVSPWVGLAGFLLVGITAGAIRTAWPAFTVARFCLGAVRRLPLRLMGFLDDALGKDVLRSSGAGYEIRHRELAEHLLRPPGPGDQVAETARPAVRSARDPHD